MKFSFRVRNFQLIFCLGVFIVLFTGQRAFAQKPTPTPAPQTKAPKGKLPVIIIPGLIGSELINKNTNETVWFSLSRSKDDDLRLPISPNIAQNQDNLIPGDILRSIKYLKILPETEIYERLTQSMETTGGYTEGKWDAPSATGYEDTYYVFPYDWRRDNVENARLLIRRLQELRTKLNHPNLKFNIIAHSMGGLIARYAARFGDADIPAGNGPVKPTWAGAKYINKICLLGTPNEGSVSALRSLVHGFAALRTKGINLPFVQSVSKFDTFTIPSDYQLLPHPGTARIYDENLRPLKLDLFDPLTWEKYGWTAYSDPKFEKEFSPAEVAEAKEYFRAVLSRAKRFQQSLDTDMNLKSPIPMYIFGADCKNTLEGMILYQGSKNGEWIELFHPEAFKRSNGVKVSAEQIRARLYTQGDGTVTKNSLLTSTLPSSNLRVRGYRMAMYVNNIYFTCETHSKLTGDPDIQNKMFTELIAK